MQIHDVMRSAALAVLLLSSTVANAQVSGGVRQSGAVTSGDCAKWVNNNLIADQGAACGTGTGNGNAIISPATGNTTNDPVCMSNTTTGIKDCGYAGQTNATFVPTDQSGQSIPFTNVACEVTVIGNLVFLQGVLTYGTSVSAAAASISIPFAAGTTGGAATGSGLTVTTGVVMTPIIASGASTMQFQFSTTAASLAQLTDANMSGGAIRFSIVYSKV